MKIPPIFESLVKTAFSKTEQSLFQFYPDVIPYDYTIQEEYLREWNRIFPSKAKYWYVDEHHITSVGRFRHGWEVFKGTFGFTNHCRRERVQMALRKFAYHGYVNNHFNSSNVLQNAVVTDLLSPDFVGALNKPDTAENVNSLQQSLKNFYFLRKEHLQPSFWTTFFTGQEYEFPDPSNSEFLFGDSMMYALKQAQTTELKHKREDVTVRVLQIISNIDPQHPKFVSKHFADLDNLNTLCLKQGFEKNEPLQKLFADQLMIQANKLLNTNQSILGMFSTAKPDWKRWREISARAELFDPEISKIYKKEFIEYYLANKNSKNGFDKNAFELIQSEDIKQQVEWVRKYENDLFPLVVKDSELGKALAVELIEKTKGYFCRNREKFLKQADQLASWKIDPSIYFDFYVEQKRYEDAYKIFVNADKNIKLNAKNVEILAKSYSNLGEEKYNQGHKVIETKPSETAQLYRESLQAKKIAQQLAPSNKDYVKNVGVHRRLVGQILITTSTQYVHERLERLNKAIKKFNKCDSANDEFLNQNYVKALKERAKILSKQCFVDTADYESSALKEHKEKSEETVKLIISDLKKAISLVNANEEPELAAELHFMLGDVLWFFEQGNHLIHFQNAAKYVPSNPFYNAAQIDANPQHTTEQLNAVWELFEDYTDAKRYYSWKEDRWSETKINFPDIERVHNYKNESTMTRLVQYMGYRRD